MVTSFVSALEFSFDSPTEVEIDEEFDVVINAETNEIYDVKIFVWKDEKSNTISEIFKENQWKNPHYYLQDVFPENNIFKNKVLEGNGIREICIRMRVADTNGFDEVCQPISILESSGGGGDSPEDNEDESSGEEGEENENGDVAGDDEETSQEENDKQEKKDEPRSATTGKIVLNSPKEYDVNKEFVSTEKKVRGGVIYGFLALCVFLIILLALRRL